MASKSTQRLDHARLAEVLAEKGLVEVETIRELLEASEKGGTSLPESLIDAGLITDWDLARVACETFQLAFLPIQNAKPEEELLEELDQEFLFKHGLVPLHRFGSVLTVVMPGLVSTEVLSELADSTDWTILPIVGTVEDNRRWLNDHCKAVSTEAGSGADWGSLFDEGDANVQLALGESKTPEAVESETPPTEALDSEWSEELGSLEFQEDLDDVLSIADVSNADSEEGVETSVDLPPMPDFGNEG